jgi:lipoprotein-anchoring transpeptidase ErfK/SrfK
MKRILFLFLLCVVLFFSTIICAIEGSTAIKVQTQSTADEPVTEPVTVQTVEPTTIPEYSVISKEELTISKGKAQVIELSTDDEDKLLSFESSDQSIADVDSGGRVDALKEGKATITATFSDYRKYEYTVNVGKEETSEYDGFSTCIVANIDTLEKNKNSGNDLNLYSIKVNRQMNCVTVYTYDENREYTVPVRAMVCSCGTDNGTITGDFGIYFKNEWHALYDNVFGHYVSGIDGDYLFHSVPYYTTKSDDLEVDEFNKLGTSASLGCVRMAVADSKWIYENCPLNTSVTIYDDENAGPLGKPETIKITDKSCGWDPTDDNKSNPYYSKTPEITGASDCTISVDGSFYPLGSVKAVDTCGNDITDKIEVIGNVITSKQGTYKVTYQVTDAMHRTAILDITVTVK